MTRTDPRMHLAVHLPSHLPWADGRPATAGRGPLDFASLERLARTAERGLFDFLVVDPYTDADTCPGPDIAPRPYEPYAAPEPTAVLSALAAVTDRIGLVAGAAPGAHEPFELARSLATLDHLSGGRAAWHLVAPGSADDGHTAEFVGTARELWDSWTPDGRPRTFARQGRHFAVSGEFTVPRTPQGRPVVIHPLDPDDAAGREFAVATADVLCPAHRTPKDGRERYADVKRRSTAHGRAPDDLLVMARAFCVLAATDAEARARAVAADVHDRAGPPAFVGAPRTVAAALAEQVAHGTADGFVLVPAHPIDLLDTLESFVDEVVPLLQEQGAFRTEYAGRTLRDHLGLPEPAWRG
ncbi:LLM class flavin-dependent oxidoreductase [Streptomyces sp. NPDC047315]|uniref:LLM class flavin-dependent oxidoreductase n=1 Tax=Streptomyces sp. NPDC047315 TaxID=3155142 RepID=UPI0033D94108